MSPPAVSHSFFPIQLTPQSASSPCVSASTTPCSPVATVQFKFPSIISTAESSPPPCSPSNRISVREFFAEESDHLAHSLPSTPNAGSNIPFMYTIFEEDSRRASQTTQLQINLRPRQEIGSMMQQRKGSTSLSLYQEPFSPIEGRPTTPEFCAEEDDDDDDEEIFEPPPQLTGRRGGMMVKDSLDDSGCDIISPDTARSFSAISATGKTHSTPLKLELSNPLVRACQQRSRKLALAHPPELALGSSLSEDVLVSALKFSRHLEKTSTPNVKIYRQVDNAASGPALSSSTSKPHKALCQSASFGQQPCVFVHPNSEHHRSDSLVSEGSRHGSSVLSPLSVKSVKSQTLPPPRIIASSDRFRKRRCSDPVYFSRADDSTSSKLVSVTRRRGSMMPATPTSIGKSNNSSGASIREDVFEEQQFVLPLLSSSSTPSTSGVDDSSCSSSPRPNFKPLNKAHTFSSPINPKKYVRILSFKSCTFFYSLDHLYIFVVVAVLLS